VVSLPGFFLDTFAMVEILEGNANYEEYLDEALATGWLQLYELHFVKLRSSEAETARKAIGTFRPFRLQVEEDDIVAASRFKLQHRRRKLSYADALGHQMAARRGMRFLTGDRAFRDIDGVEFVR